ncbi:MAG TPA: extensin family protein [Microvirga sp.]|jgi:hypothetical protein|nr:extensin family protein [Microvirga sp.]
MLPQCCRFVLIVLLAAALPAAWPAGAQDAAPPLPPPRPDTARPAETPQPKPEARTAEAPPASGDEACLERIRQLGVRFEARPRIADGACIAEAPLLVSALPDGVALLPPAVTSCPMAEGLALWSSESVRPAALEHLGTALKSIAVGTAYECRSQRSGSKMSEHAFANGLDIAGFSFEGRASVSVAPHLGGSPEAAFQNAVQKGACSAFATVLGPGSDAAHSDHLHLDQRGRRGGYRICQ